MGRIPGMQRTDPLNSKPGIHTGFADHLKQLDGAGLAGRGEVERCPAQSHCHGSSQL